MPIIQALLSAGGMLAGGVMDYLGQQSANEANRVEAEKNRNFQHAEAQEQMVWQARMSNSAYQRAVTDMKAAGLNPMLAYSQGGSSTPAGQAGSGAQATAQSTTSKLAQSIESAAKLEMIDKELRQKEADIELTKKQEGAAGAQKELAETTQVGVVTDNAMKNIELANKTATAKSAATADRAENELRAGQAEVDKKLLKLDAFLKRATPVINGVNSARSMGRKSPPNAPFPPTDGSGRTRAEVENESLRRQLKTYRRR